MIESSVVVNQPAPPSFDKPQRMSFGNPVNQSRVKELTKLELDQIVAETRFGPVTLPEGHIPGSMESITYIGRGDSIHEFHLYGAKEVGVVNTHLKTQTVNNHTLTRIVNHRKYKDYDIYFTYHFCPLVTKKDKAFYISPYKCRSIYHSRL